jgi:DNA-binding FadR family transcriptional regulator
MAQAQRTASLHDVLVEKLGAAIVHGRYPAGTRLVTSDLADEEGASRTATREAVRVLESLGLVRVRRKSGIEVLAESEWNAYAPEVIAWRLSGSEREAHLADLGALRGAVEPLAARLAARAADDGDRAALLAAVREMAQTEHDADGADYLAADVRFHRTMLRASGNPMLAALGDVVESVLTGRTRHALMPHDANPDAVRWHREAADAIVAGRGEDAATALVRIVAEADAAMRVESADQPLR